MFAVVAAHAAFASIMGKVAELGALVQRANGGGRQRAIAHGRDVEHGCRVGFVHSAPPIVVRKGSDAGSFGAIE